MAGGAALYVINLLVLPQLGIATPGHVREYLGWVSLALAGLGGAAYYRSYGRFRYGPGSVVVSCAKCGQRLGTEEAYTTPCPRCGSHDYRGVRRG